MEQRGAKIRSIIIQDVHISPPIVETDSLAAVPDTLKQTSTESQPLLLHPIEQTETPAFSPRFVQFPLRRDSIYEARHQVGWNDSTRKWARESMEQHPLLVLELSGEAGTPRPYSLRNDDTILCTLLLSIFLLVWIVRNSWPFLRDNFKDFFRQRKRANLFTDREDTVFHGKWYTLLQTSFLLSILYFEYIRQFRPDQLDTPSSHLLLGSTLPVFLGYYLLKIACYKWVNSTFFSHNERNQWRNQWFISVLFTGLFLAPLSLLIVFFDPSVRSLLLSGILLIGFVKTLLFYKTYRIFFNSPLGALHTILYFCALEFAPLFALWAGLQFTTQWLGIVL